MINKFDEEMQKIQVAREEILKDLKRKWNDPSRPIPHPDVRVPHDISRFFKPQTNYFCGKGEIDCPICLQGKLKYIRAIENGHVHAKCSTEGCVSWME